MSTKHTAYELIQAAAAMADHARFGGLDEDEQADRISQARFYLTTAREREGYENFNVQQYLYTVSKRVQQEADRLGFEDE